MSIGSFLQHMEIARQDVARSLEGALDDLPQPDAGYEPPFSRFAGSGCRPEWR